jgi:hypothetical protein
VRRAYVDRAPAVLPRMRDEGRRSGRALAYVKRAVDGNAPCSPCYETLANILFQRAKTVRAQQIAINILGED